MYLQPVGLIFFTTYYIQHCSLWRPSDSIVSEDAGMELMTFAMFALEVRRSNTRLDIVNSIFFIHGHTIFLRLRWFF
jgi:hypothetical protein